jgi:hypothetical protein
MCETTYYLLWNPSAIARWKEGLGFLLNPWTSKYLPLLHLSPSLIGSLEIWRPIYDSMQAELTSLIWNDDVIREGYQYRERTAVLWALRQFAEATSNETAIELDRWVRRHFFCENLKISLRVWKRLLSIAYTFEHTTEKIIHPPDALIAILRLSSQPAEYISVLNRERSHWQSVNQSIKDWVAVNPEITYSFEEDSAIFTLGGMIEDCVVIRCLQEMATQLTFWEIQDAVCWALMQASVWMRNDGLALCGDTLIRVELPCHDTPSVLEMYRELDAT